VKIQIKIEIDFDRDAKRRRCSICHRPVTLEDGFLELYSADEELVYPNGFAPVAVLSHAACGPDCGYAIRLDRLLANVDGKRGMLAHLDQKKWMSSTYADAIRQAARLARSLSED
jgi:hypothetical protein